MIFCLRLRNKRKLMSPQPSSGLAKEQRAAHTLPQPATQNVWVNEQVDCQKIDDIDNNNNHKIRSNTYTIRPRKSSSSRVTDSGTSKGGGAKAAMAVASKSLQASLKTFTTHNNGIEQTLEDCRQSKNKAADSKGVSNQEIGKVLSDANNNLKWAIKAALKSNRGRNNQSRRLSKCSNVSKSLSPPRKFHNNHISTSTSLSQREANKKRSSDLTNKENRLKIPGEVSSTPNDQRPSTATLKHSSLQNLPECDPFWNMHSKGGGKIHRRPPNEHNKLSTRKLSNSVNNNLNNVNNGHNLNNNNKNSSTLLINKNNFNLVVSDDSSSAGNEPLNCSTHTTTQSIISAALAAARITLKQKQLSHPIPEQQLQQHQQQQLDNEDLTAADDELSKSSGGDRRKKWSLPGSAVLKAARKQNIWDALHDECKLNNSFSSKRCRSRRNSSALAIASAGIRSRSLDGDDDNAAGCHCCCCCQCQQQPATHLNRSKIAIGKAAPEFTATAVVDGQFREIKLSDYKAKYLLLLFYPHDFTFAYPSDITSFNDRSTEFRKIGCELIACSTDSHFSHLAWINTSRKEGGLGEIQIPILSDTTHQICRDYGVLKAEEGIAFRGLFVIDDKQLIRYFSINDDSQPNCADVDATLRLVSAFQSNSSPETNKVESSATKE